MTYQKERARHEQMSCFFFCLFKSNIRETWRMILVSKADIFHTESLRMRSKSIQGVFLLHLFRNDCKII